MKKTKAELVMQLKSRNLKKWIFSIKVEKAKKKLIKMNPLYNLLFDPKLKVDTYVINKLIELLESEDNLDLKFIEIDKLRSMVLTGENSEKITDYLIKFYNMPHQTKECLQLSSHAKKALMKKRIACEELYKYMNKYMNKLEDLLIKALLNDPNVDFRTRSAYSLGEILSYRAVPHLINALKDYTCVVRLAATVALGKIAPKEAVQPLIRVLDDDVNMPSIREAAAKALGRIASNEAIQHLINKLSDKNVEVIIAVARALWKIEPNKTVQPLIDALANSDRNICIPAAKALGRIAPKEAVQPLINKLLRYPDDQFKYTAIEALGKITLNESDVQLLIDALSNDNKYFRISAVHALGELGTSDVVQPLIKILDDSDVTVRITAAQALRKIATHKSVQPPIKVLIAQFLKIKAVSDSDKFVSKITAKELMEIAESDKAVQSIINALPDTEIKMLKELTAQHDSHKNASTAIPNPLDELWQMGTRTSIEKLVMLLDAAIKNHEIRNICKYIQFLKESISNLEHHIKKMDIFYGMEYLPMDLRKYILDIAIPIPEKSHNAKGMMM